MRNLMALLAATLLVIPTLLVAQVQSKNLDAVLLDAAAAGQMDLVRSLLDNGANIEVRNELGATSLIFAAIKGHTDVVKALLVHGANVNAKTTTGITPLIAAAAGGHGDIIKLLLEKGADVSAKDEQGRMASDVAEAAGETEISKLLKSADKGFAPAPVPVAGPKAPAGAPAAQPTAQVHTETIRAGDSQAGLAVLAEPTPNGQVIAYLPVGSKVTYEGEANNGSVKLSAPIAGGWVAQRYLGSGNPEAFVIAVDNPEQCLRIRNGPGTDHEKIGCLPKGAKIMLTGTVQSGWAQIVEPMAGWVTARQIQAPGLFPAKEATAGVQKERRGVLQNSGYRRQQSDSDSDFRRTDTEFDKEIDELKRDNDDAQSIRPRNTPPGGVLRIGPFGIGLGF